MACEHCKSDSCEYVDHGNGALPLAESIRRAAEERFRVISANREMYVSAWCAETGLLPSECEIVETLSPDRLTTTIMVRRRDGAEVTPNTFKAIERLERLVEKNERLSRQRAVLRREVRRLNEKVAAMSATIYWRLGAGKQLSHEVDRRLLDGPAMWALRQGLGLEAIEVSNADVIRAAARRLGKREVK